MGNVDQKMESTVEEPQPSISPVEMERTVAEQHPLIPPVVMENNVEEQKPPVSSSLDQTESDEFVDAVDMENNVEEQQLSSSSSVDKMESDQVVDEKNPSVSSSSVDQTESNVVDEQKPSASSSVDQMESDAVDVDEQKPKVSSSVEMESSNVVDEKQPSVEKESFLQQILIDEFLGVAVGQSVETARQYLQTTSWKPELAVMLYFAEPNLFYNPPPPVMNIIRAERPRRPNPAMNIIRDERPRRPPPAMNIIRADIPRRPVSAVDNMYRPPFEYMCKGTFQHAKEEGISQNKWLIVNVQSEKEFSSKTLNLDTWRNEAVSQTISSNFIFWQVYDEKVEGQKVCNYYNLKTFPVVLVLDPVTGEKLRSWTGRMLEAEQLLENLVSLMDSGPAESCKAAPKKKDDAPAPVAQTGELVIDEPVTSSTMETGELVIDKPATSSTMETGELVIEEPVTSSTAKLTYPDLPEEPKVDKALLCRVGVRLPDGSRLQRSFLKTDPLQLLWSFCSSHLNEAEGRPFQLTQAIPGASKSLDYETKQTFEESGLSNSMVAVTWV